MTFTVPHHAYLGSPSRCKLGSAVVDGLGVEDASLGRTEEERDDPGYSQHRVGFVNGPSMVG